MPHSGQNDNLTPEAWRLIESGGLRRSPRGFSLCQIQFTLLTQK